MKKLICMLLVSCMVLSMPMTVFATEDGVVTDVADTQVSEMTEEEVADAIVENDNVPYLALGADLTDAQLQIVLDEMGITKEDLVNYNVVYITKHYYDYDYDYDWDY